MEMRSIVHMNCVWNFQGQKQKGRQRERDIIALINIVLVTNKYSKEILRSFKISLELEKRGS